MGAQLTGCVRGRARRSQAQRWGVAATAAAGKTGGADQAQQPGRSESPATVGFKVVCASPRRVIPPISRPPISHTGFRLLAQPIRWDTGG